MIDAAGQADRRAGWAVLLGIAVAWLAVYVSAAWPRLGGPLTAPVLLAHGALPTPLPPGQWLRLMTTWLVHVDPLHLAGNLAAWCAAWLPWPDPRRDRALDRLIAFVCCGLGASLAVLLGSGAQRTISAGPSGALLGLLLVPLVQRGVAPWARVVWLGSVAALLIGGALTGGDTAAHLGGALTGLGLGLGLRAGAPPRAA